MFGLSEKDTRFLRSLNTPSKVQDYLDSIPFNFERKGETCMSPKRVLRERKAHCIEGAMLAATAFSLQGKLPFILSLKVDKHDDDHVIALFKENGYWGAVSKTNHAVLRYRDPVYRSVRELAMSYFHEYFLTTDGRKTMRAFSKPINLKRFGVKWIASESDLWAIAETIFDSPHTSAVAKENRRLLRRVTPLERKAASISGAR